MMSVKIMHYGTVLHPVVAKQTAIKPVPGVHTHTHTHKQTSNTCSKHPQPKVTRKDYLGGSFQESSAL